MANTALEIKLTNPGSVAKEANVPFDTQSQYSDEITYDDQRGEITFHNPGLYLIEWWVATETTPKGAIEFSLMSTQEDVIPGCSPLKTGRLLGFGAITVKTEQTKLSLVNTSDSFVVFAMTPMIKAYLLVTQLANSGLIGVYHANLSTSGSVRDIYVGHVIYRIQYLSSTTIRLFVSSPGEPVPVDIKRSSQVDSAFSGSGFNSYSLTTTPQMLDGSISTLSTEMHRTWIRQQDTDSGLWSLYEVDLFASAGGVRVSVWVNLIYENVDLSEL